jgi:hypothetical protein
MAAWFNELKSFSMDLVNAALLSSSGVQFANNGPEEHERLPIEQCVKICESEINSRSEGAFHRLFFLT